MRFGNFSGTFAVDFFDRFGRNKRQQRYVMGRGGERRKNGFNRDLRVRLTSFGRRARELGGRGGMRRTLNGFDGCWGLSGKREDRFGPSIKRVVRDPRDVSPCRPDPGLLPVDVFILFFPLPLFSLPSSPSHAHLRRRRYQEFPRERFTPSSPVAHFSPVGRITTTMIERFRRVTHAQGRTRRRDPLE